MPKAMFVDSNTKISSTNILIYYKHKVYTYIFNY